MPSFASQDVTVVCVTCRPQHLEEMIANYERQTHSNKELIVVTNSREFGIASVRERLSLVEKARTIDVDQDVSLGSCLNVALDSCSTRFIAKFDDDDRYGPNYLADMMLVHQLVDAVIVGKQTYFAYIESERAHVLRFPGREMRYTSHVSGATLVIDLAKVGSERFPDLSIGEDTRFIDACSRRGGSIFSSDRFNYLQHRDGYNTWRLPVAEFLADSLVLDPRTGAGTVEV